MKKFYKSLYLSRRFFLLALINVFLFIMGYFYSFFYVAGVSFFMAFCAVFVLDMVLVYSRANGAEARRVTGERMSNGDENPVLLEIRNKYPFRISVMVIDELPVQFQIRDSHYSIQMEAGAEKIITYNLRPVKRGEYIFGTINVYVSSVLLLVRKRYRFDADREVKVYPSYIQMRKYELIAISSRLTDAGIKKIRRVGQSVEFDQIREYVTGDDLRKINWKATARRQDLMVNQFVDEKSQQVYSIIDKGRVMKMPFNGMSLLDYAINSSLVISNIAQLKHDKPGIITFGEKMGAYVQAERRGMQMRKILDVLYKQKTRYLESDFERLTAFVRTKVTTRSLLLFYTNFESLASMKRQLPFFRLLARNHLLVVIFFENTELRSLLDGNAANMEGIYIKTIAEKFSYEKRQIVKILSTHGIHSILTAPENLTVNTINKYLEIKARGFL